MEENGYWSEHVKTRYHPPEGTFTQSAPDVVKELMKGAGGDAHLALERLMFYMNRAGKNLTNRQALETAKMNLEQKITEEKEESPEQ